MENNNYVSIDILYEIAKDEYSYQRDRLQKIVSRVELILAIIGSILTFELANSGKIMQLDIKIKNWESLQCFLSKMLSNLPYTFSILILICAIIRLFALFINIKCEVVDIAKLYNNKIYKLDQDKIIPYLTAIYVKSCSINFNKINLFYRKLNWIVILSVVSVLLFGIAYLF